MAGLLPGKVSGVRFQASAGSGLIPLLEGSLRNPHEIGGVFYWASIQQGNQRSGDRRSVIRYWLLALRRVPSF